MKLQIKKGAKFGKLTVIEEVPALVLPSGQKNRAMLCLCECKNTKIIRLSHLVRGLIQSCGCNMPAHGMVNTGLYNSWRAMKNRCFLDSHINANRYKKRGITICKEWLRFTNFKDWALANGYKNGLTIDRRDNDKGYNPENCRWVTQVVNANNRSITTMVNYKGESQSLSLLLQKKNLFDNYAAIRGRIKRGWNADKAIDTPIRMGNYRRS